MKEKLREERINEKLREERVKEKLREERIKEKLREDEKETAQNNTKHTSNIRNNIYACLC